MIRSFWRSDHWPAQRRGTVATCLLTLTALLASGCSHRARETTALAHQRPAPLPSAPAHQGATLALPGGGTLNCPHGTEPGVVVSGASFAPTLTGGTSFAVGRYRVTVRGVVANDTAEPITIGGLTPLISGHPWAARVTVASSIPAHSSVKLVIQGTYDSLRTQQVRIDTRLHWRWAEPDLRPCAAFGLIKDH